MSIERATLTKVLRWAGRIMSLPVVLFFFIFGLGYFLESITTEGLQNAISGAIGNVYDLLGALAMVLALVGVIISWWWLVPVGIMLIFVYLLGATSGVLGAVSHVGYFNWSQLRTIWSLPGIVYPIAGVLFILSWWLTKKTSTLTK